MLSFVDDEAELLLLFLDPKDDDEARHSWGKKTVSGVKLFCKPFVRSLLLVRRPDRRTDVTCCGSSGHFNKHPTSSL